MNPKVDAFLKQEENWPSEMAALRRIILDSPLTETVKWGKPCYSLGAANVLILQPFKAYLALMFFKGVLLKDTKGRLEAPGEHSQTARQLRFTSVREIEEQESVVRAYIAEAIALEKAGVKVTLKTTPEPIPAELQTKWKEVPALKKAFESLTPGRQRAYILHFSGAKQSATRTARIEKYLPQILRGKGLHD